ncbi:hypothetical protein FACS1894186_4670 [Alphaproteobacteria bacterium]|nr:hypothetical protein FACS1894186_4670 [Alphaproteobacteria bacterium]
MTKLSAGYAALFASALMYGLMVFGAKLMQMAGLSLVEVLVLPSLLVICAIAAPVWRRRRELARIPAGLYALYLLISIVGQVGQYAGLFMGVSVSIVLFCLFSQPVWTILLGRFVLKNRVSRQEMAIGALVIAGLALLLAPWRGVSYSLLGVALPLVGGLCMAAWVLLSARLSKLGVSPLAQTFVQNVSASLPFVLAYPLIRAALPADGMTALSAHPPLVWAGVAFFALALMTLAPMLFYKATQTVNPIRCGMVLLLEPVVGTTLDTVFLGHAFTWNIAVGGALILLANARLAMAGSKLTPH